MRAVAANSAAMPAISLADKGCGSTAPWVIGMALGATGTQPPS